jgi:protein-tyrosine phosphatase
VIVDLTKLHPIDDAEMLFISPVIHDWSIVTSHGIDTVLDMEGGLDECIPTAPNGCLYVYFPIYDEDLPNLDKLRAVASLGAHLIENGHRVLSHCGMGFNRSALVAGSILHKLGGRTGAEIVERIQSRRPGALFNTVFADYLRSLT